MKKWFIRLTAVFCSLFLLLIAGCWYLLGTESGTAFIVSQAERFMGESLRIGTSKGNILDRLELSDIVFSSPAGNANVGHLVLDWKPTELLNRHLHILELSADNISYHAIPQKEEAVQEESAPFTLPELTLPITIQIEKLAINNFLFSASPESEAIAVQKAALEISWDDEGIHIHTLDVAVDKMATLQASGKVQPTGSYPLHLTTAIQTLTPDLPSLTLDGIYTGNLLELHIDEKIRGDISVDIQATLQQPITDLSWQGNIQIIALSPVVFTPDVPGTLSGTIETSGDLKHADLSAVLTMRDQTTTDLNWDADLDVTTDIESLIFDIKQLHLKHADTAAALTLSGIADLEQNLDIQLHWQQLQWPISGEPDYASAKGDATLKGTLDAFHLLLTAAITGSEIPEGNITLKTDGSTEHVQNLELTLALLGGEMELQGDVEWTPAVKWNIQSSARMINPGLHYPDWPGMLDWKLLTKGSIKEDKLDANIIIDILQGNLRELPISGSGDITIQPDGIRIDSVRVASGSAVVTANGNLGEKSNLKWQADIADFADLLPKASGQLLAKGTIRNKMEAPQLSITLTGSSIHYSDLSLDHISGDADLDLSWTNPFSVRIEAKNLKSGENLIKTFNASGKGSREKHDITLSASHDLADISLNVMGGYTEEKWLGILKSFTLSSKDFGNWKLTDPAKISAATTAASLETLCLNRDESNLCVKGEWDAAGKNTNGNVDIEKIPLRWLRPWFPDTLEGLTGLFSAKASATMQDKLSADVTAEITPGTISYITDMQRGSCPHEGLKLKLTVAKEVVEADFQLSVDSNILSGKMQSPNLLHTDIGDKARLNGKLVVSARKFDLVEALVPEVKDLNGAIDIDFTILGSIAEPDINGEGQINIDHILIPAIGLDLTGTTLDILANNKEISLNGTFNSPEGSMVLTGNASLDSSQNWPVRVTLKGDNFRLINLPEIKIFLSSDILFEKKDDLMSLTGEATIPKADILLRELPPGSQSASPDMVIIQEIKEEEPKSPFHMLLRITLGNDVHFVGFGLNTFIDGQLTILSEPEEQLIGSGAFQIKQGSFRAYGQDLDIETGVISFPGGPLSKPGINLRATRTVGDVVAGIYAIGPASKPRLTTFSNPPMSESSVISYLLTGSAPNNAGKGAKLSIGRQINNKLSVSVGTDVKTGESEFIARYRLSRKIHIQTTTGANSNAADIFYTIELDDDDLSIEAK